MNYWLVVGEPKNWETAFIHKDIWGLRPSQFSLWERIQENDKVIFYATTPVKGVIGHGVVRTKFQQDKPLWPEEIEKRKVIWPLRFEFDVGSRLPQDRWTSDRLVSKELMPRAGFQLLNEGLGAKLVEYMSSIVYTPAKEEVSMFSDTVASYEKDQRKEKTSTPHNDIQKSLVEIGKMQGYIAESEYPCDGKRLDVVWKKLDRAVPTRVFEIQVGGDIYHALGKLKHASDLWNSHIFIVAPETERDKVNTLLSGTFHEISNHIGFIELGQVEELYKRKKSYWDFEKDLGIN
jgi:predicted RNA-binding protein